jgi:PKD repeat protein
MHTTLLFNTQATLRSLLFKSALLIGILLTPFLAIARHIIGGEMTYRFIEDLPNGLKRYEFTLVVYRDCDSGGGALDNPASIGIFRGSATNATLYTDFKVNLQGPVSVSPVIPPCADASAVSNACVQRGVYVFTRDLPLNNTESYFVVYQRCCRTEQIVNIQNPGSLGATYMVELTPQAQAANNSSPVFLNYPATFICNNFKLNFDHSATDADGDSLVYSFCNPLDGGGSGGGPGGGGCNTPQPSPPCGPPFNLIPFAGVYTPLVPMGGNPVLNIDPVTGHLSGTPNILGQFVVGVCVKEYRNGVYLGMVLRDFQFNVVDCTPTVIANVAASSSPGPKQYIVQRCGEKIVTVLNQSVQNADLKTWQWEVDLKNGTVYSTNTWHLTVVLPDFGTYNARLYLNRNENCKDTAFITLTAYPGVKANFSYAWDICTENPVIFSDSSLSGATGGITKRLWEFGAGGDTLSTTSPVYQFKKYGNYDVKLHLTDSDGCEDEKIVKVDWNPKLPPVIPNPGDLFACLPEPIAFTNLDTLDLTDSKITWDFGDGSALSNEKSPVHPYVKPGIYTPSVFITTAYDCIATDTFTDQVTVRPSPLANFNYLPNKLSNLVNEAQFYDLSDSTVVQWNWSFGVNGRSTLKNPNYTFLQDTGLVPVVLRVTNQYGCTDTLERILDIVPTLRLYLPNVFAPESDDGKGNDRFGVLGIIPGYQEFNMKIWSRWGELLFESNRPEDQWNGRKPGSNKVYPPGVYIYQINMKGPRNEPIRLQGAVSLL